MLEQQKQLKAQAEEKRKETQRIIKESIETTERIKDFEITREDKSTLYNYMTKPVVKVDKNSYLTQMQADLQRVFANEDNRLILLAKLLKSDFDITPIKKEAITQETRKVKSRLKGATVRPRGEGSSGGSKALADFFN